MEPQAAAQSAPHLSLALETNAATLLGADRAPAEIEVRRAGASPPSA